jgi:hypothetical protein
MRFSRIRPGLIRKGNFRILRESGYNSENHILRPVPLKRSDTLNRFVRRTEQAGVADQLFGDQFRLAQCQLFRSEPEARGQPNVSQPGRCHYAAWGNSNRAPAVAFQVRSG